MKQQYSRVHIYLVGVFLAASIFLVYGQVCNHRFTNFDDDKYIVENSHVNTGLSGENIVWSFLHSHAHNWHPLTWISHMVDCELYGLKAGSHILTNVFFHVANSLLLFGLLKRLTGRVFESGFVAALFALHPLHVESVAWASERKDVLSTLLWLLTMHAYVSYTARPAMLSYMLGLFLFALGLLSKQMLVTVPFVLLLLDWWPLRRLVFSNGPAGDLAGNRVSLKRVIAEKIPFLILAVAAGFIVYTVQLRTGTVKSFLVYPLSWRLGNAVLAYAGYIGKMLWPARLSVFYPHPMGQIGFFKPAVSFLLLLSISFFAVWNIKKRPFILFGWLWYLVTPVPVIGLVQVGWQSMADRYTYMPLTGLFIILAWAGRELLERLRFKPAYAAVCAAVVLVSLSVTSWFQVSRWRNSITLYSHSASVIKDNDWAYLNLGAAYMLEENDEQAILSFEKAIEIKPGNTEAHYNLGLIFGRAGRYDEAVEHFEKVLQAAPENLIVKKKLGYALLGAGRTEEAIGYFEGLLRRDGNFADEYSNIGVLLARQGRADEAVRLYNRGLKVSSDCVIVLNNLAWLLSTNEDENLRDGSRAVELAERACELGGYSNGGLLDTLAAAYASAGRFNDAVSTAKKALSLVESSNAELAGQIKDRLELYKQSKAYIEKFSRADSQDIIEFLINNGTQG